tara:strand:- start:261 stop:497 length:237 start_codon:yes stop_codon:yes gene_type:complete
MITTPKQLQLPFGAVGTVEDEKYTDYEFKEVDSVKHKIKRVETNYEKMMNGAVRVKTSEFTYLADGRIITAHTTEILD